MTGTLVQQRVGVESAQDLLGRLGAPPEERSRGKGGKRMSRSQQRSTELDSSLDALSELPSALQKAGASVSLEELFSLAGYDRHSPEQVEAFYLELRRELGRTLRIVGDAGENGNLELTKDASG